MDIFVVVFLDFFAENSKSLVLRELILSNSHVMLSVDPYNAEIFLYDPWRPKFFLLHLNT